MSQKKIAGLNLISQITSNNLANFRVKADRPDCPICPIYLATVVPQQILCVRTLNGVEQSETGGRVRD